MVLSFTAQSILSRWLFLNGSVLFLLRSFHTCTVCPHNSSSSPQKSNSAFCLEWGFPSKRDGHSPLTDTAGCSQWSLSLIHYHKIIVPKLNFYRWFETLSQRKKKEKKEKTWVLNWLWFIYSILCSAGAGYPKSHLGNTGARNEGSFGCKRAKRWPEWSTCTQKQTHSYIF